MGGVNGGRGRIRTRAGGGGGSPPGTLKAFGLSFAAVAAWTGNQERDRLCKHAGSCSWFPVRPALRKKILLFGNTDRLCGIV